MTTGSMSSTSANATQTLEVVAACASISPPTIEESYVIPQFGDWPFAFTRIDAWETFFESFGLHPAFERQTRDKLDRPLQIVLEPPTSLDVNHVGGYPVIPRAETIEYMRENYAQFQSALEIFDRMYEDLKL